MIDASETDDESLIGDVAHIVARSPEGSRGESDLPVEQRDKYSNLILLCKNHHKLIDDQPTEYPVERLHDWKKAHEEWVKTSLTAFDPQMQRVKERYADLVQEWAERADLDNWTAWTSPLLSHGQPSLAVERLDTLEELDRWLFDRVWPGKLSELEAAFENFRRVVNALRITFQRRAEDRGGVFWTEKFYRRAEWGPGGGDYGDLSEQYDRHVDLVQDLTLELTRAANYVCDWVRHSLDPSFRTDEGVLIAQSGPHMDLSFRMRRVEYRDGERVDMPFRGLEPFSEEDRFDRDQHFGHPRGGDLDEA